MSKDNISLSKNKLKKNELSNAISNEIGSNEDHSSNVVKQQWEDLENIYQQIGQALVTILTELSSIVNNEEIYNYIKDKKTFDVYIKTISDDGKKIADDLATLHDKHKGMTGFVKDGQELSLCLSIFEEYVQINNYFHANVTGTWTYIAEILSETYMEYEKNKKSENQELIVTGSIQ